MNQLTLGVFSDREHAEAALSDLEKSGYNPKEISLIMKQGNDDVVYKTGNDMASGAASGATTGGMIGGLAGLLIGIGALSIPGIGAVLIGGPIAAALGLTGAAATTVSGAVTGALAGGLVGALVNLGVPKDTAEVYERRINDGGVLLAVPSGQAGSSDSRSILESHGADQIRSINLENRETIAL